MDDRTRANLYIDLDKTRYAIYVVNKLGAQVERGYDISKTIIGLREQERKLIKMLFHEDNNRAIWKIKYHDITDQSEMWEVTNGFGSYRTDTPEYAQRLLELIENGE